MNDTTMSRIADALERIASALERTNPATPERVEAPEPPQNAPEPEKVETPEPAADPEPVAPVQPEEKPSVTLEQIRKQVVTLSAMGAEKKAAVREIILKYAPNVSGIMADKYPEVMEQLDALKEVKA